MGNWTGRWSSEEDIDPDICAQVVPLGKDRYQIRLASKLFLRCPALALIETESKNGVLEFKDNSYYGRIANGLFSGGRGSGRVTFEMKPFTHVPPTMGLQPPEGAIVLFNGENLDSFIETAGWIITDGAVMVTPQAADLVSKDVFKDIQLHVEFRTPLMPQQRGQSRGNSGVFVQDAYEIQVLDSFGLEGTYDECGALYKASAPYVNACLPPGEWQTYDITFKAAQFAEDGKVQEYPRATVLHNGYVVQKDQEIPWITAWKENERLNPPPKEPGHIKFQSHRSHYVQYRNLWVKPF